MLGQYNMYPNILFKFDPYTVIRLEIVWFELWSIDQSIVNQALIKLVVFKLKFDLYVLTQLELSQKCKQFILVYFLLLSTNQLNNDDRVMNFICSGFI